MLNKETGEPVRSRHCKGSLLQLCHWIYLSGKAKYSDEPKSGELPVGKHRGNLFIDFQTHERWAGG